jgi:hypothetical protein
VEKEDHAASDFRRQPVDAQQATSLSGNWSDEINSAAQT